MTEAFYLSLELMKGKMFSVATMYEDGFKEGVKWAKRDIVKARPFKNYRIIKKSGRLVRANELGFVRGYRSISRANLDLTNPR